jgi:hypothetical protein
MAPRSQARTVFNRSNTGIVSSNPARDMDVRPCFSVLCCPVWVEALRRDDPPVQGVLPNVQKQIHKFHKSNSESEKARRPNSNLFIVDLERN